MSDLVFIAYPSEQKAEEVREKVLEMQKEYLIELGDAVVAVKDDKGRIKLNQLMNTTAAGAASGAMWGALVGLVFLNPLLGAAIGAGSGALGGKLADVGINDPASSVEHHRDTLGQLAAAGVTWVGIPGNSTSEIQTLESIEFIARTILSLPGQV